MKILLCGGLGFIGKNFLILRPKNWEVYSLDLSVNSNFQKKIKKTKFFQIDLTNPAKVKKIAQKINEKFDVCLHLAANGDPALSVPDPGWDLLSTTSSLINVCQNFNIKKIIYFSSGAVYNGNKNLITEKTLINPTLPYAISHLAAEQYCRFYQKSGKIKDYLIIRFFGAYGPYEPKRKIYSRLIKELVIDQKKEFIINGNGLNLIDAMYVKDAIKGIIKTMESDKANFIIDFCKGDHLTINQLVEEIIKIFNVKIKIVHYGNVPEYNQFYASPIKFHKNFNFRPKISLEVGLKKLYSFLNQND